LSGNLRIAVNERASFASSETNTGGRRGPSIRRACTLSCMRAVMCGG
jgi:hypothetical protein